MNKIFSMKEIMKTLFIQIYIYGKGPTALKFQEAS